MPGEFDPNQLEENVDIVRYDPNVHGIDTIIGGTSLFHGFFSGSFIPGAFVKAGLNFESSRQADRINSLEVGAVLDVFYKKVPMMGNEYNKNPYPHTLASPYSLIGYNLKRL